MYTPKSNQGFAFATLPFGPTVTEYVCICMDRTGTVPPPGTTNQYVNQYWHRTVDRRDADQARQGHRDASFFFLLLFAGLAASRRNTQQRGKYTPSTYQKSKNDVIMPYVCLGMNPFSPCFLLLLLLFSVGPRAAPDSLGHWQPEATPCVFSCHDA